MPDLKIFADNPEVASEFARCFRDHVNNLDQDKITVCLSGGSTPKLLFQVLAADHCDSIDWSRIHFFWGDERCVAPEDQQSNYGECKKLLLDKINIPVTNIHRVVGESAPETEAKRYGETIKDHVALDKVGRPEFDVVILGMGGDGHTASIFPHQMELLTSEKVCEVAVHPESGQKRVTITGPIVNAAKFVVFLITGAGKADVLATVYDGSGKQYPATHVQPRSNNLAFFLDKAAAAKL